MKWNFLPFTTPSASISKAKLKSNSKEKNKSAFNTNPKSNPKSKAEAKSKYELKPTTTVPVSTNTDELEKMEIAKNRPLPENTWYEWCDWLIDRIPESVKKSISNTKQKYEAFGSKNREQDDKHIESKSENNKKLLTEQYLQNIRPYLHDAIDNLRTSGK